MSKVPYNYPGRRPIAGGMSKRFCVQRCIQKIHTGRRLAKHHDLPLQGTVFVALRYMYHAGAELPWPRNFMLRSVAAQSDHCSLAGDICCCLEASRVYGLQRRLKLVSGRILKCRENGWIERSERTHWPVATEFLANMTFRYTRNCPHTFAQVHRRGLGMAPEVGAIFLLCPDPEMCPQLCCHSRMSARSRVSGSGSLANSIPLCGGR